MGLVSRLADPMEDVGSQELDVGAIDLERGIPQTCNHNTPERRACRLAGGRSASSIDPEKDVGKPLGVGMYFY